MDFENLLKKVSLKPIMELTKIEHLVLMMVSNIRMISSVNMQFIMLHVTTNLGQGLKLEKRKSCKHHFDIEDKRTRTKFKK